MKPVYLQGLLIQKPYVKITKIMQFKIDIYNLRTLGDHSSEKSYYGSIIGETAKNEQWLIDFFHYGGRTTRCIEGLAITSYSLDEYIIVELTGFLVDGEFLRGLIVGSKELKLTRKFFSDVNITEGDEDLEYLIIGDDTTPEDWTREDFTFIESYDTQLIKSQHIVEWGASGFFEVYILGIISGLSTTIIEKLIAKGLPSDSIKKFKLPSHIKKQLAKEYNVPIKSLFLENYYKEDDVEYLTFRSLNVRIHLKLKYNDLISLNTEILDRLL